MSITDTNAFVPVNSTQAIPSIIASTETAASCVREHDRNKTRAITPAEAAFILADAEGNPIYANLEAKKIVTYPEGPRNFRQAWAYIWRTIFSVPNKQKSSSGFTFRTESRFGKRKYVCLAIFLNTSKNRRAVGGSVAIVLERCDAASHSVGKVSARFRLTERERAVVELLMEGLTNKEIAARLRISPNTVRSFIRMVMGKLGVTTRSGIVGTVFRGIEANWSEAGLGVEPIHQV